MKCSLETTCSNPKLETVDNQVFCFNCYGLYEKAKRRQFFKNINVVKTQTY